MKTVALTLVFQLTVFVLSYAQTDQGRWQIGTQIGHFRYQNGGQYATKSFAGSIAPTVGHFVAKNLLIGAGVPLSHTTAYLKSPDFKTYQTSFGLSPFLNYYFGQSKLKPYIGIAYSYNRTINYYRSFLRGESSAKGYSTVLAPYMGIAYFVSPNIALNAGLSFNVKHQEQGFLDNIPLQYQDSHLVDSKFSTLDIGFQLYLGK